MSNLTFYDRQRIELYLNLKRKVSTIAKWIGKDRTVVWREIKRNKPQFNPYNAELAQKATDRRARITNKRKLDKCEKLKIYVRSRLKLKWSPEQIAGRLSVKSPPSIKGEHLCMETIYQYIYAQKDGEERWFPYLKRAKRTRQKRYSRKKRIITIPDRVSIHERDKIVSSKERYGDWESDTVCFGRKPEAVSTHYERKSFLVRIEKLENKTADETEQALTRTMDNLPPELRKTITFDNGGEGARHTVIRDNFNVLTYFCDTYSAWQKGGVENMNGLIREYLPKKADITKINQKQLKIIQELLNNRPRKGLGYLTPNEVISSVVNTKVLH
jgi:IS30 family transposase